MIESRDQSYSIQILFFIIYGTSNPCSSSTVVSVLALVCIYAFYFQGLSNNSSSSGTNAGFVGCDGTAEPVGGLPILPWVGLRGWLGIWGCLGAAGLDPKLSESRPSMRLWVLACDWAGFWVFGVGLLHKSKSKVVLLGAGVEEVLVGALTGAIMDGCVERATGCGFWAYRERMVFLRSVRWFAAGAGAGADAVRVGSSKAEVAAGFEASGAAGLAGALEKSSKSTRLEPLDGGAAADVEGAARRDAVGLDAAGVESKPSRSMLEVCCCFTVDNGTSSLETAPVSLPRVAGSGILGDATQRLRSYFVLMKLTILDSSGM